MRLKFCLSFRSFTNFPSLVAMLLLSAVVQAQTTTPPTRPPQQNPLVIPAPNATPIVKSANPGEDDSYRVGPGDVLDIRVFGRPELGREARVTNQGKIRLPFLDDLQVACLTEAQMAQLITEKYKKYLRDPQVDVFVKEYKSQPVAVIGMVTQPGRFQLQRRVRLLELLTFSGGPNLNAGGVVHIIRGTAPDFCEASDTFNGGSTPAETAAAGIVPVAAAPVVNPARPTPATETVPDQATAQAAVDQGQAVLLSFRLKEVVVGNPESNPYVKPGDIISIPETDQIFVIGNVVKPGPVSIRSNVTLLQAIGNAGGFMPDAARGRVKVVRIEPGTKNRKEFVYDVNDIQKKKAEDVALMPNDVVEVPASVSKNTARSLLAVGVGMVGYLPYLIIR